MRTVPLFTILFGVGLINGGPIFAQNATNPDTPIAPLAQSQKTDGESPTMVGPGSAVHRQKTDGESPTMIGPGSAAYKQQTQSLSHGDPNSGVLKQN
jgi:hypothetical protein